MALPCWPVAARLPLAVAATSRTTTGSGETPVATETPAAESKTGEQSEFFVQADYDKQLAQRSATPEGPADKPWEQMIEPGEMVDTSEFKSDKADGWNVCFSNAANDNPWRQNGGITMKAEADNTPEIGKFTVVDAEAKDDKQISDIESMTSGGKCDVIIIAPNTTATLTPAVEKACESDIPVIVFDRGVTTDCPVTFIHPIGGYAFGADAAEFLRRQRQGGRQDPRPSHPAGR